MEFAVNQELEKYDIEFKGQMAGLYTTYFYKSPVLFNLITRSSLFPFQYEAGSRITAPVYLIDNDNLYEETLEQEVGDHTVERLCHDMSPIQMLRYFEAHMEYVEELGICEYWNYDLSLLLDVMKARMLAWKRIKRGRIGENSQGIVQVKFGTALSKEEEQFVLTMNPYHKLYKQVGP